MLNFEIQRDVAAMWKKREKKELYMFTKWIYRVKNEINDERPSKRALAD